MRDLINAGLESLLEFKAADYVKISEDAHDIKDELLPGLKKIAQSEDTRIARALVQALFESGFLSSKDICYNMELTNQLIYGAKAHETIETFLEFFEWLQEGGFTSLERSEMYNPSGDNYCAAFEYTIKPKEDEIKVHNLTSKMLQKEDDGLRTDAKRKVIYLESQSPAHAIILEYCVFSNKPKDLIIMKLRNEWNDRNPLGELDGKEFDVSEDRTYTPYNLANTPRIITTLKIEDMSCNPVYEPHEIDRAIDRLYVGHFNLEEDKKEA